MPPFKQEFKRQIRLAVTAAIGFIIAFTWREAIITWFNSFVSMVSNIPADQIPPSLSAITMTILGVIAIVVSSKLLK